MNTEEVKKMLAGEGSESSQKRRLLSSGSSLLNLACSGDVRGAFVGGHYYFFCGDSMCGKTWLAMSCFAEASIDSHWDKHRLVYDSTEEGALMNLEKFFGKKAAERIEWLDPPSSTAESFYFNVDDALEDGRPFVYILDSQDSLSSDAEHGKFDERKKAFEAGKETAGSYGDNKAKVHSANLRKLMGPLKDSGSILIVLNQTRDSFSMFQPSSYSGGRALLFYATLQLWGSVKQQITKTIKKKKRELGVRAKIMVKKNRLTGRKRTVEVPIYHSFGIDDIGSCVEYLAEEGVWKESKGKFTINGLGPECSGRLDNIVGKIEEEGLEEDLRMLVQKTWDDVEEACKLKRRSRYG